MPTLDWIGKRAVLTHHRDVPYRTLVPVPEFSCLSSGPDRLPQAGEGCPSGRGEGASRSGADASRGNLIVQGDNLHALKALLPRYKGQVKCIYIDPPYNTGNEGWAYNDNVNSPEIRKWLGEVVGKEGETLDRHDRWLCMMYPRLVLLKQFLRPDGAIFVSIDDNEVAALRLLMDEVFGAGNFVATVLWQKVYSPKNSARHFSEDHDYVVVYALSGSRWVPNLVARNDEQDSAYKNRDNDPRGPWKTSDLSARNFYGAGTYPITCPSGRVVSGPPTGMYWRVSETKFRELDADKRIWWGKDGSAIPQLKRFLSDVKQGVVPQTMWFYEDVGHTQEAKKELVAIVPFESSDDVFITPKPTRLLQRILQIASDKDSLILDSFAGSGTTGHAVLKANAADGGERRFILVEMDERIAQNVTAERVRRVAQGYTKPNGEAVAALGGGFTYCTLSPEPMFDAQGAIRASATYAEVAEFVWFMVTGGAVVTPDFFRNPERPASPLLGVHEGTAIYLLYNGILKDRSDVGGNVLNTRTLEVLPPHAGPRIVYGARCRFDSARLKRLNIEFRQLPYELAGREWN